MQPSAFAHCLSKRLAGEGPGACALWKLGYSPLFIVFVFFFFSWDWKKRQLLVVCFDANVGYCRGATGDGDTGPDLAAARERMLSCKRTQFHSRDAKKRPKQAAL